MSKTANHPHRRTMRAVTPAARAGRAGAGAAMAAAMLFGGASAATAETQADAPQADAAPALIAPAVAPAVTIPTAETEAEEAEPALAPAAGSISIEVGPTEEEIAAAEEAAREAAEAEAAERAEQESQSTETRQDEGSSRSEERSSRDNGEDSSSASSSESSSEESEEQSAPAPSAAKGSSILATARSGIGTPYVYGGESPSGWDCSGLVQWVYAQHGINLPRGAAGQAAAGTVIPRSQAQPGDLVYKPGHIGIYAGGNQFVDAGNSRVDTSERNIFSGSWTFIRVG